jgi:hypothetical protein
MKKNHFIVNVVLALTMAWKKRYINDQWEQLHWEFFNGCFFVWKHPVHTTGFLIWAPRLIKILSFFYPLLISIIICALFLLPIDPSRNCESSIWLLTCLTTTKIILTTNSRCFFESNLLNHYQLSLFPTMGQL